MSTRPASQSSRSKARKRALDVLFEADQRGEYLDDMVAERKEFAGHQVELPSYALEILDGVVSHGRRVDELIETHSLDWPLERMPAVDRAILRLGVWELLYTDTTPAIVMSEAVALANDLSTDDSGKFINGLLGRIAQMKPMLQQAEPSAREYLTDDD